MRSRTTPTEAPLSAIEAHYRRSTPASAALMRQAASAMPGGNTRTTSFYPPYPLVFERSDGPWLWDADGRRYVDLFLNGLSLIHGNNYPPVNAAISAALERGTAWSGASREQITFAHALRERIDVIDQVRFTNSGSEAAMLAVKAARHFTGRPLLLKSVGAYHGSYPDLEAGLYGTADIEGRALVAPSHDPGAYERLMAHHGQAIAALVIEPVLVTGRVVPPEPGFLKAIEALARRYGALTLLDDCLMLRLAVGGSAEAFDLHPDLVVLGKFLGGGTALGAFGGARAVMSAFDPTHVGSLFHGGSFNGNLIGCSAGLVTLQDLTAARIAAMDAASARLRTTLEEHASSIGLEVHITGVGSVCGIAFAADPTRHEDDPAALGLAALFHLACLNEGVCLGTGGIVSLSTAHDGTAIDCAISGICAAFDTLAGVVRHHSPPA